MNLICFTKKFINNNFHFYKDKINLSSSIRFKQFEINF